MKVLTWFLIGMILNILVWIAISIPGAMGKFILGLLCFIVLSAFSEALAWIIFNVIKIVRGE